MERVTHSVPALLLAAASFSGILSVAADSPVGLSAAFVVAVAVLLLFRRRKGAAPLFIGVFALMGGLTLLTAPRAVETFVPQRWRAVVETVSAGERSQRGIARLLDRNGMRVSFFVGDVAPQLRAGDIVAFEAPLQPVGRYAGVPGMEVTAMAERAERVSATVSLMPSDLRVEGHSDAFKYRFDELRQALADAIYASPLSVGASRLLVASCLGTGDADMELKDNFRAAGLSHLLCVSGFHVGIVAWLVSLFLLPMRYVRHGRARFLLIAAVVWLYAFVTGFGAPVVRASIMLTVYYATRMLQRGRSPFNALCVAFFAVLLVDPWWLFSAGFQLSFAAVAALLVFAGPLNPVPVRYGSLRSAVSLFVVPLAVVFGSAPVMLVWFHRLPVLTMPANAVAALLFPLFMASGALAALTGFGWLCGAVDCLYGFMTGVFDRFGALAEAVSPYISLGPVSLTALAVAVVCTALFVNVGRGRARLWLGVSALSAFLCVGCEPVQEPTPFAVVDSSGGTTSVWVASEEKPSVYVLEGKAEVPGMAKRFFVARGVAPDSIRCLTCGNSLAFGSRKLLFVDKNTVSVSLCDVLVVGRSFGGDFDALLAACNPRRVLFSARLSDKRRTAFAASCARTDVPSQRLAAGAVTLE